MSVRCLGITKYWRLRLKLVMLAGVFYILLRTCVVPQETNLITSSDQAVISLSFTHNTTTHTPAAHPPAAHPPAAHPPAAHTPAAHTHTTHTHAAQERSTTRQIYIPDHPSKNPVGQPADIPSHYLIEEGEFCRRSRELRVVGFVHSAIDRVHKRHETRVTWANASAVNLGVNLGVVFMVGRAKNQEEEKIVRQESSSYHDIVQGDYADDYHLLSYKALSALNWVSRHCGHVPWTLHADDDLLIDVFLLQEVLQKLNTSHKQFLCKLTEGPVKRRGRYKVTKEEFSNKWYPSYCQGPVWVLATQYLPSLLQASTRVNYLWVDDVYITGLLARQANLTINNIKSKVASGRYKKADVGKKIAWFHLKKVKMSTIWPDILQYHKKKKKPVKV